jgi:hypothetical protein
MTAASGEACVHSETLRAWTAPRSRLWLVILGLIIIILTGGDSGPERRSGGRRLLPGGNVG